MYDWDRDKARLNQAKHGVSFERVQELDWDRSVTSQDDRFDYGEKRFILYAPIRGRLHVLVYVSRDGDMRVISLRKANSREIKNYERIQTDRSSHP